MGPASLMAVSAFFVRLQISHQEVAIQVGHTVALADDQPKDPGTDTALC